MKQRMTIGNSHEVCFKKKKITLQIQTAGSRQEDMVAEGKKLSSDPSPKKNSDIKKFKVFQDQIPCNNQRMSSVGRDLTDYLVPISPPWTGTQRRFVIETSI